MYRLKFVMALVLLLGSVLTSEAKKYKWELGQPVEVCTIGQGKRGTQMVKAWAVAKNADKAIEKAKMDAVTAALFYGIPYDASTYGMGVSNLGPLLDKMDYQENQTLIEEFFKKGEFLNYVMEVNSSYPSGENNIKVDGGRRIGIRLLVDYPRLRQWISDNNIKKGLGDHFK